MRRTPVSTQGMSEFQRLIRGLSDSLLLHRPGRFWELWFAGDDFGKSEAEIAELNESGYYPSYQYGTIAITPQGAIRSLDFGTNYEGLPVLAQLLRFLERTEYSDSMLVDVYTEMKPNGSMIDVDVRAVEDNSGFYGDEFRESTVTRTIARFTFDPANNLLLHRTV